MDDRLQWERDRLQREREAFEAHLLREGWRPSDVRRDNDGRYVDSAIRWSWAGWLARSRTRVPRNP